MPTPTYIPLATKTLTATATSVTFSSISQAYRDLVLVTNGLASAKSTIIAQFNGDTAGNYPFVRMAGNGSTASSESGTLNWAFAGWRNTTPCSNVMTIMDYSATDKHKSLLTRGDEPLSITQTYAQRWANTAAITTISVSLTSDTFIAGSTFTLYGIQ